MRAISSTTLGTSTMSGRQEGGVTVRESPLPETSAPMSPNMFRISESGTTIPTSFSTAELFITSAGITPAPAAITRDPRVSLTPPAYSSRSDTARSAAASATRGSTPRAKRFDASLGSLCRRWVRAIEIGSNHAASTKTFVVESEISVEAPPMTPARPIGPDSSVMRRSSGWSFRSCSSSVRRVSPSFARRTVMPPESASRS